MPPIAKPDRQGLDSLEAGCREYTAGLNSFLSALANSMLRVKRAYESFGPEDGWCVLVDRLWPRGVSKAALGQAVWLKEVAPSADLRRWFKHEADKWDEFRQRYFAELDGMPQAWEPLLAAARQGPVTLIYGAKDTVHNNAVALKEYLEARPLRPRGALKRGSAD